MLQIFTAAIEYLRPIPLFIDIRAIVVVIQCIKYVSNAFNRQNLFINTELLTLSSKFICTCQHDNLVSANSQC